MTIEATHGHTEGSQRRASLNPRPPAASVNDGTRGFRIHEEDKIDAALVASWIRQASARHAEACVQRAAHRNTIPFRRVRRDWPRPHGRGTDSGAAWSDPRAYK